MKAFDLVYVVEDDRITSKITELHLLQHASFGEVQKYLNGQPAFDALVQAAREGTKLPDLILLDLNMPVMDGWEFLDAFSARKWQNPVCVCLLTSSIRPEDIEKAKTYNHVKGYFSKPIDEDVLNQVVGLMD